MGERSTRIVEEAERDPAGGELLLGAVVVAGRDGGGACDAIGGLGIAEVEQLSGDKPPLDPPLVAVERLPRIVGDRQHQLGSFRRLLVAAQPLGAAEDIADVAARLRGHPVELRLGVGCLFDNCDTGLGDDGRVAADAIGRAHGRVGVLRIEPDVHARFVVGVIDQVPANIQNLDFEVRSARRRGRLAATARELARTCPGR